MPAVPEFLLRRLFLEDSLKTDPEGFSFSIFNRFAPATITAFRLAVDGQPVPPARISIKAGEDFVRSADSISSEAPFTLPVNTRVDLRVSGVSPGAGELRFIIQTVEVGELSFSVKVGQPAQDKGAKKTSLKAPFLAKLLGAKIRAVVRIDADKEIGEINPYIYGHFIEHLERCVYGGVWSEDGSRLREDTLRLIQALKPPLIRYPGGNFASGYHWEDGVGPLEQRPRRYDQAWKSEESNRVGTDEFIEFCRRVGAQPFLVVNDATGSAEEAARWVAYCNQPADGEQGRRRAANGHPDPYNVRLWGVGNEVWGPWQIGHTGAGEYAARIRPIIEAMRAADPAIKIVAVGDKILSDAPDDPGRLWNQVVLSQAGDLFQYLSFHLYQPDQTGWQESRDESDLFRTVCAAPLSAERAIQRLAEQIGRAAPGKGIKIALDEWNLWLAPPEDAETMHRVRYTLRDALYVTGMLNVFHRQCRVLQIANLAQLVNVLPLIVTNDTQAYATPIYYPFLMYRQMEPIALETKVESPTFNSQPLGNIEALQKVPWIDVTATRSRGGRRLALGVVNRDPYRRVYLSVRLFGFSGMRPVSGWLLNHPDPLAENSFARPENVKVKEIEVRQIGARDRFTLDLPPHSVSVLALEG
jgi:alpha-N-arabinofuranosidase